MLHENNVMFRDTDILPDNTYTHVNNGSQTCSWLDHIAMSDVLSESTVDCHTLQDVVCSDHCAITVTLNFDQLPMTYSIEGQKAKHINYKFEDAGLNVGSISSHLRDCCGSTGVRMQIGLMIC